MKVYTPRSGKELDAYIEMCRNESSCVPRLKGEKEFQYLYEKGIIRNDTNIRTMYNRGGADGAYSVDMLGRLAGMEAGPYSGQAGAFDPKEILSIENAPSGWDLDSRPHRKRGMEVILTGFQPFGRYDFNPTMDAVKAYNGQSFAGIHVNGLVLPATYNAFERLEEMIKKIRPQIVLGLGFSSQLPFFHMEMVAKNEMFSKYADADGKVPHHALIKEKGPRIYKMNSDVHTQRLTINQFGIPAESSTDADSFICNSLMYNMLHFIKTGKHDIKFSFMHTPGTEQYAARKGMEGKTTMPKEYLENAIKIILQTIADYELGPQ
jgi:pyroglutamyl-peptidase